MPPGDQHYEQRTDRASITQTVLLSGTPAAVSFANERHEALQASACASRNQLRTVSSTTSRAHMIFALTGCGNAHVCTADLVLTGLEQIPADIGHRVYPAWRK